MSLINDMLRDLERRRPTNAAPVSGDIRPAPRARRLVLPPGGGVLALAGLVAIAGVAWVAASGREESAPLPPLALVEAAPVQEPERVTEPVMLAMVTETAEVSAPTTVPGVRWVGVDTEQAPGMARLSLRFSAPLSESVALRRVGDDEGHLPLSGVDLADAPALPVAPATGPLRGLGLIHGDEPVLQFRTRPGSTVLLERNLDGRRLTLVFREPSSTVAKASVEATARTQSRTDPVPAPTAPQNQAVQQTSAPESARPVARRSHADHYAQAMEAVRRGDLDTGERELRQVLERAPHLHEARESLATLLAGEGRHAEAMALLEAGQILSPARSQTRLLLARLKAEQHDLDGAVALLEAGGGDAESLAALAALYQRQGRAEAAVAAYRRALTMRTDVGAWWVGLGIALESAGSAASAPQAYRRALMLSGVDPRLSDYAQSRLQILEARP